MWCTLDFWDFGTLSLPSELSEDALHLRTGAGRKQDAPVLNLGISVMTTMSTHRSPAMKGAETTWTETPESGVVEHRLSFLTSTPVYALSLPATSVVTSQIHEKYEY